MKNVYICDNAKNEKMNVVDYSAMASSMVSGKCLFNVSGNNSTRKAAKIAAPP